MMSNQDTTDVKNAISMEEFQDVLRKAKKSYGLSDEDISKLRIINKIRNNGKSWHERNFAVSLPVMIFLLLLSIPSFITVIVNTRTRAGGFLVKQFYTFMGDENGTASMLSEDCLIPTTEASQDPFRPPVNCDDCKDVKNVAIVSKLSHEDFLEKYAFTMQPVLIVDAQDGWTASKTFSFDFFKDVYKQGSEALEKVKKDCQFFPYSTEFEDLGQMLNMSKARAEGKEKPWYVGWSNCDGKAANTLRKHYKFPYFLPPVLDHSKTDWVFMGLPGYGANMHIDNVGALSWQAQVKGTKRWTLQTPPECAGICVKEMEIIVKPGEIIVLDTNRWFHSTLILGNETSIVIGSEYY